MDGLYSEDATPQEVRTVLGEGVRRLITLQRPRIVMVLPTWWLADQGSLLGLDSLLLMTLQITDVLSRSVRGVTQVIWLGGATMNEGLRGWLQVARS